MELEVKEQHEAHSKAIPVSWNHLFCSGTWFVFNLSCLLFSLLKDVSY